MSKRGALRRSPATAASSIRSSSIPKRTGSITSGPRISGGTPADIYRVEPRDAKSPIRYYQVWVGGNPKRILQVESLSLQGTRAMVKISPPGGRAGRREMAPAGKGSASTSPFRKGHRPPTRLITRDNPISGGMRRLDEMSGEGDITIAYTDWRVNTGLDDSLFKE